MEGAAGAEISIEADPGTFDAARLRSYLGLGVTRVSVGVQVSCEQAADWSTVFKVPGLSKKPPAASPNPPAGRPSMHWHLRNVNRGAGGSEAPLRSQLDDVGELRIKPARAGTYCTHVTANCTVSAGKELDPRHTHIHLRTRRRALTSPANDSPERYRGVLSSAGRAA